MINKDYSLFINREKLGNQENLKILTSQGKLGGKGGNFVYVPGKPSFYTITVRTKI